MVDVRWTIYDFKNRARESMTRNYHIMKGIVELVDSNKYELTKYLNDEYNVYTSNALFGDMESDKSYYANEYEFSEYFKDEITEIKNVIADKVKVMMKDVDNMKSDLAKMEKFVGKLESFCEAIGSITKRTANKELDWKREEWLPLEDEFIDNCKNLLGLSEGNIDRIKNGFEILKLDNQTIKENA